MKIKRILWLYNHVTLIKSEVPILRDLGYEVYIPKVIPFDVSVAVDWEADQLLSIPGEAIDILNKVDFYDSAIPQNALDIMNEYFDIALFGVFVEPLKSLVCGYKGILLFHPFGLEDGMSYTKLLQHYAGTWLLKEIEKLGTRFWFGQSYENLYEIECEYFKKRSIDLPIGLKDITIQDDWTGKRKKVLFVCPRIKISPYYEKIYKDFKKEFRNIPHSIGGAQPIPVEGDDSVLGFLPLKEFEELYPSHSVMFYHSTNKRHIHYHPFEGIKRGLPLIFMAGGLMDELGGKDLPGRCKTIAEAKRKCRRILNGDIRYADWIRKTQAVLLEPMSYEACKSKWEIAFQKIESESFEITEKRAGRKKLAMILPQPYEGGVLDYTLRLARAIQTGARLEGDDWEIVFGVPAKIRDTFAAMAKEMEASIRTLSWEIADEKRFRELTRLLGYEVETHVKEHILLHDGISYFEDCDFLLFLSDRVPEYLYLYKPYGVIVHDYIQRYVPQIATGKFERCIVDFVRKSEANFSTTEWALKDCIQFVGAKKANCHKLPLFFEDVSKNREEYPRPTNKGKKYFVWSTNISFHKKHEMALKGLEEYYLKGGTLPCYVTGVDTDLLAGNAKLKKRISNRTAMKYVKTIQSLVQQSLQLKKYVRFVGNLAKYQYWDLLSDASFMLHVGEGDNGNGAIADAAFLGVPGVSSDYPPMREMDRELGLEITFYDKDDSESLSSALLRAEETYKAQKEKLKNNPLLQEHSIGNGELCRQIYRTVAGNIKM